jgi:signal transduction histidine kinase
MSTSYYFGYDYYIKNIYFLTTISAAIGPIYLIYILTKWIITSKLYKDRTVQITFGGWLIFAFDFICEEFLPSIGFNYPMRETYLGAGISVLVYAFALAVKFNNEYKELHYLKNNLETQVKIRTGELEIANNQKTSAFINLAHEIKTPLTILNNSIEKITKNLGDNEELKEIRYSVRRLLQDTTNFMDAEKLQKGMIFYDHSFKVDVSTVLSLKIDTFKKLAENRKISLVKNITSDCHVKADPFAIDRIINNVLDNAIKYNKDNGSVSVMLLKSDDHIKLIVQDTGIGISEEQQKSIFNPYFQVSHTKRNLQGMGMGLFITAQIVKELSGSIVVESILNKETSFIITLPLLENETIQNDPEYTELLSHPIETPIYENISDSLITPVQNTILIVEDNLSLLHFLKKNFLEYYNILVATNGKEALQKMENNYYKPDIIICDIMMDEMDGIELLKKVRTNETAMNATPFLLLTARTSKTDIIEGLKFGAIDYIGKPFSMELLFAKVKNILENINLKKEYYRKERYYTIGMLSASIAHEIMNPLMSIQGSIEIINECFSEIGFKDETISEAMGYIRIGTDRIEQTVDTIRMLYSPDSYSLQETNTYNEIEKLFYLIKKDFPVTKVKLVNNINRNFYIQTNKIAFSHIITNLISNSVHSINDSGEIAISSIDNADEKTIIIADNGCGIPKAYHHRIFEPAFTLKNKGHGTGMGLFIIKEICTKLKIRIYFESEINQGTSFFLTFPTNELSNI